MTCQSCSNPIPPFQVPVCNDCAGKFLKEFAAIPMRTQEEARALFVARQERGRKMEGSAA